MDGKDEDEEDEESEEENNQDQRESRVEQYHKACDVWVLWKPAGLSTNEGTQISTLSASLEHQLETCEVSNKTMTDEQLLSIFCYCASYYNHSIVPKITLPFVLLSSTTPMASTFATRSIARTENKIPSPGAIDQDKLQKPKTSDQIPRVLLMVFQLRRGVGGLVLGSLEASAVAQLRQTWCEIRWVMVVDGLWVAPTVASQDVHVLRSARSWSCDHLSLIQTTSRVLLRDDGVNADVKRLVRSFRLAGHPVLGKSLPGCHTLRGNAVRGTQIALLGLTISEPYNIICNVEISYVGKLERLLDREHRRYEAETLKVQLQYEQLAVYLCSLTSASMSNYEAKMLDFDLPRLEQAGTRSVLARVGIDVPSSAFCDVALRDLLEAYQSFASKDLSVQKRLIHAPHESRRLGCFLTFELKFPSSANPLCLDTTKTAGKMILIGGEHCSGSPIVDTCSAHIPLLNSPVLCAVNFNQNREDHSEFVGLETLARLAVSRKKTQGHCDLFITHWPCVSCLGAIVQFQALFPLIALRVGFEGWKEFQLRLRTVLVNPK